MRRSSRAAVATLCLAWLMACADVGRAADSVPRQLRDFPETALTITRQGGRDSFRVWVADTPERQQQGLMFVRTMPRDRGMVFPQRQPRVMSMWMKNTYIPLDMLFIGPDQTIIGIAENTVPQSLETVTSPGPITAVLELNAGEARRRDIRTGDRVSIAPY